MKKGIYFGIFGIFLTLVLVFTAGSAFGAIDFGGDSYGSDLNNAGVVETVQDAVGDISLDSINSTSTVETAKSVISKIGESFKKLENWLREKAGIDLIGIFKTLLTWFVAVVEWMIEILKWLVEKI